MKWNYIVPKGNACSYDYVWFIPKKDSIEGAEFRSSGPKDLLGV
jgi:hypothetical protein